MNHSHLLKVLRPKAVLNDGSRGEVAHLRTSDRYAALPAAVEYLAEVTARVSRPPRIDNAMCFRINFWMCLLQNNINLVIH